MLYVPTTTGVTVRHTLCWIWMWLWMVGCAAPLHQARTDPLQAPTPAEQAAQGREVRCGGFVGVRLIEGTLLTPRLVGDQVGLLPLVVMIALIVGGSLLGIWGMLLAIPITAVLSVLANEWMELYRATALYQGTTPDAAED